MPATSATTLDSILAQFRDDARSNRDLGDRFERLIVAYLRTDPLYAEKFSDVWLFNDWPDKGRIGDTGIDIVARERATGEYCAIQCKFYLPEHTISKGDLDSFFTAAGKEPFTSCIIISTTDRWGKNAEDAMKQTKPVSRIALHDLRASPVDWTKFDPKQLRLGLQAKKELRPHQEAALRDVLAGFKESDRGKLIMACGTGKTFTALRIAEKVAPGGTVLFLVPSLALLSQSLKEWTAEAKKPIHSLAVCSDANIGKRTEKGNDDTADITVFDLAFPATTSARQIVAQFDAIQRTAKREKTTDRITVIFSTYQSIDAVSKAQKAGLPEFDLIICDEAHRTTGVTLSGEDESHFVQVHKANFLKSARRLYMTATPRLYGDEAKSRAKDADAEICSMDDVTKFGPEFHRLGFGEAVSKNLLADYKVLVLAVDEKYISRTFQRQIADKNNELRLEDAVKITGCWNGLAKRFEAGSRDAEDLQGDTGPMRRAVAFSRSIKDSEAFVRMFAQIIDAYREKNPDDDSYLRCEADHVDGTFNAQARNKLLDWLKAPSPENTCRILSNARCLSEGVDVPALDAVLFLNPRDSVVDVVQSVGRVMRRAERKQYGYIILPIGVPADMSPEEALRDHQRYRVVWQVLQALRAHDDRFNATINQIELNQSRPDNIQVIGVGASRDDSSSDGDSKPKAREVQGALAFPQLDEWKDAIYSKIVLKCGDRRYWETWAADVAKIAERHTTRIKALLDGKDKKHVKAFDAFLKGLQTNLNPAVSKEDAIEMLSQHLITRPIFDALFSNYAFAKANPVSKAMQEMLDALDDQALNKETEGLGEFYNEVRKNIVGQKTTEGRQKLVVQLYDRFFRIAFPRMAERLGIVYTPVEVVDFIVRSVEDVLREEFGTTIGAENVHIIDPFTGTGTFVVRLLQSGLIKPKDLPRKYKHELHANEIVLLAYYIAAINIEETYHGLLREAGMEAVYEPFEGIVLTDTFQMYESKGEWADHAFPDNHARVKRQKAAPIRVVMSNPPYSAQQESANDNNANLEYVTLDARIRSTYAARSKAPNLKNLYDSYIRAIRWATDRINGNGVVAFVTNGSFIDANNMDGLRACLVDEFTGLYVFNLRGHARGSGEFRKAEAGNVFGAGTRTGVGITVMVKNPAKTGPAVLRYHDIGDYLSQTDKLAIVGDTASIGGLAKLGKWQTLTPNADHDWINQRDPAFEQFMPLGDKEAGSPLVFFDMYSQGLLTARDSWCYNASRKAVAANMRRMVETYTADLPKVQRALDGVKKEDREDVVAKSITTDAKAISWSRGLKADIQRGKPLQFVAGRIVPTVYRPYSKQFLYFDDRLNEYPALTPRLFPEGRLPNLAICVDSRGSTKVFSALMVNTLPDYECISKGQCFPLYAYAPADEAAELNFGEAETIDGYRRRDAITDAALKTFRAAYGPKVTKETIFYYVYGVLHSPEYRTRFASNLKKELPRIPLTKETADFQRFSKAGRDLAHWHLNYETIDPYPLDEHSDALALDPEKLYTVTKMTYARPNAEQKAAGQKWDKTTIKYNAHITLSGIPAEALGYVVNGKPALEWVMEQYQLYTDPVSGIKNDPNDWSREHKQPRYIIDLVKRVVRVSVETVKIVKSLPALNERV
ncbi:MAG TPA: type ISP restriction/modification enzyme [Phycisphaerales bacterium]|nr:type ISP restriction/modification enzyme [Phycisphaerales bacterium]